MHELPDGSGFFVGLVGPREPGFINWLKYRPQGCARLYLFRWRMFWVAYPEIGFLRSLRYVVFCLP